MQKHPPGEKVTTGDHARKNAPKSRPALGEKTPERNRPHAASERECMQYVVAHILLCGTLSDKCCAWLLFGSYAALAFYREEGNCEWHEAVEDSDHALPGPLTRYRIVLSPT